MTQCCIYKKIVDTFIYTYHKSFETNFKCYFVVAIKLYYWINEKYVSYKLNKVANTVSK